MYSERKIHRNFHYQPINLGKKLIYDNFLHKSEILRVNASNKTEMITHLHSRTILKSSK
jgi:hypothetical protein